MECIKRQTNAPGYFIYALGTVLYLSSLLQTGYKVFFSHQAIQIPIVNLLNDPSLYPGDPYREALLRYPSYLWHLIAWGARLLPLETLLLGLFLVERILVIVAAGYLARAIMPKSHLATVGTMALCASHQPVTRRRHDCS